jgi:3-hydroxyisobutyrate dehydrogenase
VSTVGFIGLGHMGAPMAARLVAARITVRGLDRVPELLAAAEAAGVTPAGSLAELAATCETVILSLPSSDVVDPVVAELLGAPTSRIRVIVDMSSSEPFRTQALASAAWGQGIEFADAPVSGGVLRAQTGELSVMVGGSVAAFRAALPLLEHLGTSVVHVGPAGSGHAVKALNNYLNAAHLLSSTEALVVAAKFGVGPGVFVDVVNGATGRSASTEFKLPRYVLSGAFDSGFSADLLEKDLRIAVALEESMGVTGALARSVLDRWALLNARLARGADHTEIVRPVEAELGVFARSGE